MGLIAGDGTFRNANDRRLYSCVRILAEVIGSLPLHVNQQRADGGKEKALDHPLYRLL